MISCLFVSSYAFNLLRLGDISYALSKVASILAARSREHWSVAWVKDFYPIRFALKASLVVRAGSSAELLYLNLLYIGAERDDCNLFYSLLFYLKFDIVPWFYLAELFEEVEVEWWDLFEFF